MFSTPSNHSQAALQFIAEVEAFEKKHNKKLSEFLPIPKDPSPENEALVTEFFSNPIIHHYLTRDADTIQFIDNKLNPSCLTSPELEIYALRPDIFPFRLNADIDHFYLSGADESDLFYISLQKKYNNNDLIILSVKDVYEIRNYLNMHTYLIKHPHTLDNPLPRYKFILTPNWKDDHATAMFHILNPETGEVLASIFINSWDNKEYSDYIDYRFNTIRGNILVKMKMQEQKKDAEKIITHQIPLIDASHDIQVTSDDSNCTLYGYNFLDAIAKMLDDSKMANHVFDLAVKVSQKDQDAKTELQSIFRETLKKYLPCYYQDGKRKQFLEFKEFHLVQRWNMANEILSRVYPVKSASVEIIAEPKRPKLFRSHFTDKEKFTSLQYVGKNETVRYIFNNVLSVLEQEKLRLLQKYPPTQSGTYVFIKRKHKDLCVKPWLKIQRLKILENLIKKMHQELANFEENPHPNIEQLQKNLESMIKLHLDSKKLDKYQRWGEKLGLIVLNAIFSIPLFTIPVKKYFTKTCFFSLAGKTQEATEMALENVKKCKYLN